MITEKRIQQFKALYRKHFGVDLSDDEAFEKTLNLLELYQAVFVGIKDGFVGSDVESRDLPPQRGKSGFSTLVAKGLPA